MDGSPPRGGAALESARALGTSMLAWLDVRAELAALELREQAGLGRRAALLAAVAAVFLAMAVLLLAFLVVVYFWDTHRMAAIAGVTLAYSGIGAWAVLRLRALLRDSPPPFGATLAEFRKDLDTIRGRDERNT